MFRKRCSLSNELANLVGHKLRAIGGHLATMRGDPVLRMKSADRKANNNKREILVLDDLF